MWSSTTLLKFYSVFTLLMMISKLKVKACERHTCVQKPLNHVKQLVSVI